MSSHAAAQQEARRGLTTGHAKLPRPYSQTVLLLVLFPFIDFVAALALLSFLYHFEPYMVVAILSGLGTKSMLLLARFSTTGNRIMLPLAVLSLAALLAGCFMGYYNYTANTSMFQAFDDHRMYTNVLAGAPAAAHDDAGVLVFADSVAVDTSKSVGFKFGTVYCAAPVVDTIPSKRADFWAVGYGCCEAKGAFTCNDATDSKAKTGVVLQNTGGVSGDYQQFLKAVKEAGGTYELEVPKEVVLVHWVRDPDVIRQQYNSQGLAFFFGAVIVVFALLAVAAAALADTVRRT